MSEAQERKAYLDELFQAAMRGTISRRELLTRAVARGVAAPVAAALLSAHGRAEAAIRPVEPSPSRVRASRLRAEQVIRLPEGPIVTLDPGVSNGGTALELIQNTFEGLVGIDQRTGQVELLQAEKMVMNDDASEYTFTLRDGVKFSDGTPITAYDYEWSWRRVILPETKSDYVEALYPVKGAQDFVKGRLNSIEEVGIKALDDKTLRVVLVGPTPYFPLLAATWTFSAVPRHVIERAGVKWTDAANFVSNGPFTIKEWNYDQSMTLVQNPHYWGPRPTLVRAEYTLFADPVAQAIVAFENDELDQAEVPGGDLERVRNDSRLSKLLGEFPRSATQFVAIDTAQQPFDDVRFRQALSMSINRRVLAEQVLKGAFTPTQVILAPDIPGYNPEAALGEDVDKARQLLAQVGSSFPQLTLVYRTFQVDKQGSEYLQAAWKQALGLDVKLEALEPRAFAEWRAGRKTAPFNMYYTWWGSDYGDPANWHNFAWESQSNFYFTRWKNDEFDRLVNQARGMTDVQRRIEMYKQAEAILVREVPAIPLYNLKRFFLINPKLKGVYHYPILGRTWLKYISIED